MGTEEVRPPKKGTHVRRIAQIPSTIAERLVYWDLTTFSKLRDAYRGKWRQRINAMIMRFAVSDSGGRAVIKWLEQSTAVDATSAQDEPSQLANTERSFTPLPPEDRPTSRGATDESFPVAATG